MLDFQRRRVLGWAILALPDLASQLAREHRDALYAFALTLCGEPAEASDLVQDTFERALRRLDSLRPETNARAWLCTILHHLFFVFRVDHRQVFFKGGNKLIWLKTK